MGLSREGKNHQKRVPEIDHFFKFRVFLDLTRRFLRRNFSVVQRWAFVYKYWHGTFSSPARSLANVDCSSRTGLSGFLIASLAALASFVARTTRSTSSSCSAASRSSVFSIKGASTAKGLIFMIFTRHVGALTFQAEHVKVSCYAFRSGRSVTKRKPTIEYWGLGGSGERKWRKWRIFCDWESALGLFRLPHRGVDFMDFPTLAIEANLDAFFLCLSNVFTATCRTKLDLADSSIWFFFSTVSWSKTARCVHTLGFTRNSWFESSHTLPELVPTSLPWLDRREGQAPQKCAPVERHCKGRKPCFLRIASGGSVGAPFQWMGDRRRVASTNRTGLSSVRRGSTLGFRTWGAGHYSRPGRAWVSVVVFGAKDTTHEPHFRPRAALQRNVHIYIYI